MLTISKIYVKRLRIDDCLSHICHAFSKKYDYPQSYHLNFEFGCLWYAFCFDIDRDY